MLIALLILTVALLVADAYQTVRIALTPAQWLENGLARFAIGQHPTATAAVMYFAFWLLTTAFVVTYRGWPEWVSLAYLGWVSATEAYTVYNNYRLGIR